MEEAYTTPAEPFHQGWIAGIDGLDPRLCPYEKMTKEWREWQSAHGKATDYRRFTNITLKKIELTKHDKPFPSKD